MNGFVTDLKRSTSHFWSVCLICIGSMVTGREYKPSLWTNSCKSDLLGITFDRSSLYQFFWSLKSIFIHGHWIYVFFTNYLQRLSVGLSHTVSELEGVWKGPLEIIQSKFLAKAHSLQAGNTGKHPGEFCVLQRRRCYHLLGQLVSGLCHPHSRVYSDKSFVFLALGILSWL